MATEIQQYGEGRNPPGIRATTGPQTPLMTFLRQHELDQVQRVAILSMASQPLTGLP